MYPIQSSHANNQYKNYNNNHTIHTTYSPIQSSTPISISISPIESSSNNNRLANIMQWNNYYKQMQQQQEQLRQQQLLQEQMYRNNSYIQRRNNFVNEFTEFVINTSTVKCIEPYTKFTTSASSPALNRRGNNNSSNSSQKCDNSNNNLATSSTIICSSTSNNNNNNNRRRGKNSVKLNINNKNNNNNINNNSSSSSSNNNNNNNKGKPKKQINITSNTIISSSNNNNNNSNNIMNSNDIIALTSRNMQVVLKQCKPALTNSGTATATCNNALLKTLPRRGIIFTDQQPTETYVIDDQEDEDEVDAIARTEQIMRKFRIPKGTALLPKLTIASNNSPKYLLNSEELGAGVVSIATPTPPPTVGTPNSTSSSIGFLEEVIEGVEQDDLRAVGDDTNTVIIEAPLATSEVLDESEDLLEEDTHYLTEDNLLAASTASVPSTNSVIMTSSQESTTTAPLQLQTLQPNGAITCINLPPNTILLSSADGTILATTAPANNKMSASDSVASVGTTAPQQQQQQQQLIALQDWPGTGAGSLGMSVGGLPQNVASAATMLLTNDGTAIPIMPQSLAAAAAANELLKTQVLA